MININIITTNLNRIYPLLLEVKDLIAKRIEKKPEFAGCKLKTIGFVNILPNEQSEGLVSYLENVRIYLPNEIYPENFELDVYSLVLETKGEFRELPLITIKLKLTSPYGFFYFDIRFSGHLINLTPPDADFSFFLSEVPLGAFLYTVTKNYSNDLASQLFFKYNTIKVEFTLCRPFDQIVSDLRSLGANTFEISDNKLLGLPVAELKDSKIITFSTLVDIDMSAKEELYNIAKIDFYKLSYLDLSETIKKLLDEDETEFRRILYLIFQGKFLRVLSLFAKENSDVKKLLSASINQIQSKILSRKLIIMRE
jgi:hypothetical protein